VSVQELDLAVTFLDVGHGDAAILRFREDRLVRTVVVDGGGPAHSGDLLAFLLRNGITVVDLLVATHVDRNHIAGLLPVVESDEVVVHHFWGPVCESAQPSVAGLRLPDERAYQRFYSRILTKVRPEHVFSPVRGVVTPAIFTEAAITVLNPPMENVLKIPPKDVPPKKPSDAEAEQDMLTLVLHIESHGIRILLGSDARDTFWAAALRDPALQRFLDVNVFKVPRYGQPVGFPPDAASVVHAEYAVFSLGTDEDQQPAGEVVALFRDMQAEVLCTQHAEHNAFCGNPHCHAANGGQNVVFCRVKGASSYSTSAYFCPQPQA
jgi:beta-lactamase superfamily II metal-dependent hydrolase